MSSIFTKNRRGGLKEITGRPERDDPLFGPSGGIRTHGLMLPKHPRYQLRYTRSESGPARPNV